MSSLSKNTPTGKGIRSAYQSVAAAVTLYFTGLVAIPEVRDYTYAFVTTHGIDTLVAVLIALGASTGAVAFIQNYLESLKK